IALDDRDDALAAKSRDRLLEERGLAGARRAHDVQGKDAATREPAAIALGEEIVVREDIALQRHAMRMIMIMIVMMVVVGVPQVFAAAAGRAHCSSTST